MAPKPAPPRSRKSRRWIRVGSRSFMALIHVEELVGIEQHMAEVGQRRPPRVHAGGPASTRLPDVQPVAGSVSEDIRFGLELPVARGVSAAPFGGEQQL